VAVYLVQLTSLYHREVGCTELFYHTFGFLVDKVDGGDSVDKGFLCGWLNKGWQVDKGVEKLMEVIALIKGFYVAG
jgi:hypothetical protein